MQIAIAGRASAGGKIRWTKRDWSPKSTIPVTDAKYTTVKSIDTGTPTHFTVLRSAVRRVGSRRVRGTGAVYRGRMGKGRTRAALMEAPYQDTQVQNFQGGFCVSGGKWFRSPV